MHAGQAYREQLVHCSPLDQVCLHQRCAVTCVAAIAAAPPLVVQALEVMLGLKVAGKGDFEGAADAAAAAEEEEAHSRPAQPAAAAASKAAEPQQGGSSSSKVSALM
jgi:hypothetical protein